MRIILKKGTFDFSNHQFMSLYYKTTLQIGQWGTYLDIQFPALLQVMAHSMYFMKTGIAQ